MIRITNLCSLLAGILLTSFFTTSTAAEEKPKADDSLPPGALAIFGDTKLRASGEVTKIAFSPDGRRLATANQSTIDIWDSATGALLQRLGNQQARSFYLSIIFAPDGKSIITADRARGIQYWRLAGEESDPPEVHLPATRVRGCRLLADGKTLAVSLANSTELFDVASCKKRGVIENPADATSFTISPDGKKLATFERDLEKKNRVIRIRDVASKKILHSFPVDFLAIRQLTFSPSGDMLYSRAARTTGFQQWDIKRGNQDKTFQDIKMTISVLVVSPDGKSIAIGDYRNSIFVYDVQTGKRQYHFNDRDGNTRALAFSPDGKMLASGGKESRIYLRDLQTGKPKFLQPGHDCPIASIACSPDGTTVATIGRYCRRTILWDISGKYKAEFRAARHPSVQGPSRLEFSRDGNMLASLRGRGKILLWDWKQQKISNKLPMPMDRGAAITVSPNRQLVAVAVAGGNVEVRINSSRYDIESMPAIPTKTYKTLRKHHQRVTALCFAGDGQTLFSGSLDQTIYRWDIEKSQLLDKLAGHRGAIRAIVVASDDSVLVSAADDGTVRLWNLVTRKEIHRWQQAGVVALALSPDEKTLACGRENGSILWLEIKTGKRLAELQGHRGAVTDLQFSPDGKHLASGGEDSTSRLWNLKQKQEIHSYSQHAGGVSSLCFLNDGKWLAAGDRQGTVVTWETATGKQRNRRTGFFGGVVTLAAESDGKRLIVLDRQLLRWGNPSSGITDTIEEDNVRVFHEFSMLLYNNLNLDFSLLPGGKKLIASSKKSLKLWDIASGEQAGELPLADGVQNQICVSRDGRLVCVGAKGIVAWDIEQKKRVLQIPASETGMIYSLAFSPAEPIVAAVTRSGIRLWEVPSGKELPHPQAPPRAFGKLQFSPDGTLLGLSHLHRVSVWEVHSGQLYYQTPDDKKSSISSYTFTPNGKALIAGYTTGVAIVWKLKPAAVEERGGNVPSEEKEFERLWNELASEVAAQSYRAEWQLSAGGDPAVTYLQKHFQKMGPLPVNQAILRKLLADLESDDAATVRRASSQMRKIIPAAAPQLRQALAADLPPRVEARIRLLLAAKPDFASREEMRLIRSLRVLRRIGTDPAFALLQTLAQGYPHSHQTQLAAAVLAAEGKPRSTTAQANGKPPQAPRQPVRKTFDLKPLQSSWKIAFKTQGLPAKTVLERLGKEMKIAIDYDAKLAEKLKQPVTRELQGQSHLASLEAVCRQFEIHPVYPTAVYPGEKPLAKQPIELKAGLRKKPATLAGPFLLEVDEVREFTPLGTGAICLALRGYGLPPSFVQHFLSPDNTRIEIDRILDNKGLVHKDLMSRVYCGTAHITSNSFQQGSLSPLTHLLQTTKTLPDVTARIVVRVPRQTYTFSFEPDETGVLWESDGMSAMLDSQKIVGGGNVKRHIFNFELTGITAGVAVGLVAYDADGKLLKSYAMPRRFESRRKAVLIVDKQPARVAVTLTRKTDLPFEFRLANIPLPSAKKQPPRIEVPKFDGHPTPVTATIARVAGNAGRSQAVIRFKNQTAMDVRMIAAHITLRNAFGERARQEIRIFLNKNSDPKTGHRIAVLNKNDSYDLMKNIPGLDRYDYKMTVEIHRVEFVNAAVWKTD